MDRSLRWVVPSGLLIVVLFGFLALLWDDVHTGGSTLAQDAEQPRKIDGDASSSVVVELGHENPPAVRETLTPDEDPGTTWESSIRILESNGSWSHGKVVLVLASGAEPSGTTYDTDEHGVWKGPIPARPQRVTSVLGERQVFAILDAPTLDAEDREIVVRVEANPAFSCTVTDAIDGKNLAHRARLSSQGGSVDEDAYRVRSDGIDVQTRIEDGRLRVTPVGVMPRTYWVAVEGYAAESFLHVPGTKRHAVALAPQATLEIVRDEEMQIDLIRADRRIEQIDRDGPTIIRRTVPAGSWRVEGWLENAKTLRHAAVEVVAQAGEKVVVDLTRIDPTTARLDIRLIAAREVANPKAAAVQILYQPKLDGSALGKLHVAFEETLEDWHCVETGRIYSRSLVNLSPGIYTLLIGRLAIRRTIEVVAGEDQRIEVEPPKLFSTRVVFEGWPESEFPVQLGWRAEDATFGASMVPVSRPNLDLRIDVTTDSTLFFAFGRTDVTAFATQRIDPSDSDPRVILPAPTASCVVYVDFLQDGDPFMAFGDGRFEKLSGPGFLLLQSSYGKRSWARILEFSVPGKYELQSQDGPRTSFQFEIDVGPGKTQRWVDLGDPSRSR